MPPVPGKYLLPLPPPSYDEKLSMVFYDQQQFLNTKTHTTVCDFECLYTFLLF